MAETFSEQAIARSIQCVQDAAEQGLLTVGAVDNIKIWLTDTRYVDYVHLICEHIEAEQWQALDDVFWTVIPFGTGGRRGRMYPFGSNAINTRTIGESAQGLADCIKQAKPAGPWSCGIAYDTRHRSREFAELCAGILVANGFHVFFIDDYRSTPELSFLIRYKKCDGGIMVTASHNPPSDNAVKVYWSNGGQLVPPHDRRVVERVEQVGTFEVADFATAVECGSIELCKEEVDRALLGQHVQQSLSDARDIKIIYSPLHGVGEFNVRAVLAQVGFKDVEIYEPHREPNGDFPNVPGHVSNPENPQVFTAIVERAKQTGAELILATDPDCDRLGVAAPLRQEPAGEWGTLDGNQIAALLADFILAKRQEKGRATDRDYIVTTLVTTPLLQRIAQSYGVTCYNKNLVGFKWIAELIDRVGPEGFAFGAEESHGYLVGTYARDKDGVVACLLMSQLAVECKAAGISLHEKLADLHRIHGLHTERLATLTMEGSDGMRRMKQLMDRFRDEPLQALGGQRVHAVGDYLTNRKRFADGTTEHLEGPTANLIVLETEQSGNFVAVRPSGTEPKIKMYMFGYLAPEHSTELAAAKETLRQRLDAFETDIQFFAQ